MKKWISIEPHYYTLALVEIRTALYDQVDTNRRGLRLNRSQHGYRQLQRRQVQFDLEALSYGPNVGVDPNHPDKGILA
jgi:hypothetical protein